MYKTGFFATKDDLRDFGDKALKILNIEDNNYNVNQLIEISRPNTLNLITHIIQTLHQSIEMHSCEHYAPNHTHSFRRHLPRLKKLPT